MPRPVRSSRALLAGTAAAALLLGGAGAAAAAPHAAPHVAPAGTTRAARGAATPANAVALAASFRGVPYVWGGSTPRGFDCSGLVQYVFRHLGVSLPRTAQEQYDASRHITAGQLRAGDLVFYGAPRSVHHVGIYAGGGRMWDAPHTGTRVRLQVVFGGRKLYGRVLPDAVVDPAPAPAAAPAAAPTDGAAPTYQPFPMGGAAPDGGPAPAQDPAAPTPASGDPTAGAPVSGS